MFSIRKALGVASTVRLMAATATSAAGAKTAPRTRAERFATRPGPRRRQHRFAHIAAAGVVDACSSLLS